MFSKKQIDLRRSDPGYTIAEKNVEVQEKRNFLAGLGIFTGLTLFLASRKKIGML